jgi:hypothetical protein
MTLQTVDALAHKQVNFTVETLPWPHTWGATYRHLLSHHGEQTPRGPVLAPRHLHRWHLASHEMDDAWLAEGEPTTHPHLHASLAGRIRLWWEFR